MSRDDQAGLSEAERVALAEAFVGHRQEHRPSDGASVCACGKWEGPFTMLPFAAGRSYQVHLAEVAAPFVAERTRAAVERRNAVVWVDPGRCGGTPCAMGTRIGTDIIAGVMWHCGLAETLTMYPHLDRPRVLGACWFEAHYGRKRWMRRWGAWLDAHGGAMWAGRWDDVPEPPSKDDQPAALGGDGSGEGAASGATVPLSDEQGSPRVETPGTKVEAGREAHGE